MYVLRCCRLLLVLCLKFDYLNMKCLIVYMLIGCRVGTGFFGFHIHARISFNSTGKEHQETILPHSRIMGWNCAFFGAEETGEWREWQGKYNCRWEGYRAYCGLQQASPASFLSGTTCCPFFSGVMVKEWQQRCMIVLRSISFRFQAYVIWSWIIFCWPLTIFWWLFIERLCNDVQKTYDIAKLSSDEFPQGEIECQNWV